MNQFIGLYRDFGCHIKDRYSGFEAQKIFLQLYKRDLHIKSWKSEEMYRTNAIILQQSAFFK